MNTSYEPNDREPWFRLSQISHNPQSAPAFGFTEQYEFLACTTGIGELTVEQRTYPLTAGRCYLLPPGMLTGIAVSGHSPLRNIRVVFDMLQEEESEASGRRGLVKNSSLLCDVEVPRQYERVLHRLAQQLDAAAQEGVSHLIQPLFYKLAYQLLACGNTEGIQHSDAAIRLTIGEMNRRYAEPWTRDELALLAGMSPWHYSHMFKRITGLSPIRYLTNIRMQHAKELLLRGNRPRDVAHTIGYGDDAHFRRMFKESTGHPPSVYISRGLDRIATVSYSYAAHLLALDITPCAAPVDRQRESHRTSYHERIAMHLLRSRTMSPEWWDENETRLIAANPQMILCDDMVPDAVMERLRRIAPAIVVPWMAHSWREQFQHIASLTGKAQEARRWMDEYEHEAAEGGLAVRQMIGSDSISIIHLMLGRIVVYGLRNGGAVLYEDMKLQPPAYDSTQISVCKAIAEHELMRYSGERMILVIDSDEATKLLWQKLRTGRVWQSLRAVQAGQVYPVNEVPWLEYSPLAHRRTVEEVQALLAQQHR